MLFVNYTDGALYGKRLSGKEITMQIAQYDRK